MNDDFTSGGAQMRGGRRDLTFEAASDLDYVRGNHSWRTGVLLEGGRYTSDDTSNYLGTYTFAPSLDPLHPGTALDAYDAGTPSLYTRRIGDPYVQYAQVQAAGYVQDDWRALRSLLVSVGVRYGVETHVADAWNLSPRVSARVVADGATARSPSARATATSTTGSRPTPTSRRCSWTGPTSAR